MNKEKKIYYFDYNATTPVADEVLSEMTPYFSRSFGNPSSIYRLGNESLRAVTEARRRVAKLIGAGEREIIFTSCGTESNNMAVWSALQAEPFKRKVVTTAVEHSSIRNLLANLSESGVEVTKIPVSKSGELDLVALERELTDDVAIVTVMWANNETGVVFPIERIVNLVKSKKILFHVDAVQAVGKIKIDLSKIPVDYLSLSAHKFYGPKGIGALYVRKTAPAFPLILGGHQERDLRAGTENVPAMVGLGKAAELLTKSDMNDHLIQIGQLRDQLEKALLKEIPGSFVNGKSSERICNTLNITIPNVSAEVLIPKLDEAGICVSSGSACMTGALEPSIVLQAMGLSEDEAKSSIRFSLGCKTTQDDIDYAVRMTPKAVEEIRKSKVGAGK